MGLGSIIDPYIDNVLEIKIKICRLKRVMQYLAKQGTYLSANDLSRNVGMSWNTAKKDLELLVSRDYVIKVGKARPVYTLKR